MTNSILDTNVVIDLLRQIPEAVLWFSSQYRQQTGITPTVWMEVVQGARDKNDQQRIIRFLHQFRVEHPIPDDNRWAIRQLAQFHLSHGVELEDVLIDSVAARLAIPLYTSNLKHYHFLPGVQVIKPY